MSSSSAHRSNSNLNIDQNTGKKRTNEIIHAIHWKIDSKTMNKREYLIN